MANDADKDEAAPSPEPEETEALTRPERRAAAARPARSDSEPVHRSDLTPVPEHSRVGRFLLLKKLGQGGMGVVYSAYDPDLDRKVALKLLLVKGHRSDLETGRLRLLREAQAMARVSHPHVIPVFEVGTWEAQVFVAMELVDGGTLREWSQAQPRSWREVLEKFLAAGQGLAAAHRAGLIHRDFKPANVLVSRAGRVYVTDFGLARQVELPASGDQAPSEAQDSPAERPGISALEEALTLSGMVVGTPNYMSPEQFKGAVLDGRSDQFSFCASLYLALYGKRPFDPQLMSRAVSTLRAEGARSGPPSTQPLEPSQGSALSAALIHEPPREAKVPAWVRSAVMRGLALEPGERFASMEALLEALSQEQRLARRRRHTGVAALAAVALLGTGGVVYQQSQVCTGAEELMAEVWGPPARQRVEGAFRATGNPVAQEMFQRASRVLDQYASVWARQHTEACEATRVRQVQTEALLSQQVVCLERRRKSAQALVKALAEVDRTGVDKALDAAYALPAPRDCADLEALSEQQARPADPAQRAELEQLEGQLAEVKALLDLNRYAPALEQVRQLQPRVLATGYPPLVAEARFHEGWLQSLLGEKEQGASLMEQAVYDAEVGRADMLEIFIINKLIFAEGEQKRYEQAARWARLGEATLQRLGGEQVMESDLLVSRANLALWQDRPEEALQHLERARALLEPVLEAGHPKRARVTFTLGRTLLDLRQVDRAAQMFAEALRQTEAAVGPQHLDTARRHQALSIALREQKDFTRALEHARASVAIHRALLEPRHLKVAYALDHEGMSLLGLGRHEDALRVYEEALEIKRKGLAPDDDELQYSLDGVGQALLGLGRTKEAVVALKQALAFTGVPADALGDTGFALARALWREGSQEEARAEANRALERFIQANRPQRATEVRTWLQTPGP